MNKKTTISIRNQYIFFTLLPIGVLIGGFFLAYIFYEKLYEKREKIYDDIAMIRWEEEQLSSFEEFARQKEMIEASEHITERFVLQEDQKIQFVSFAEQIATEEDVSINITTKEEDIILPEGKTLVDKEEYTLPTYKEYEYFDLELTVEGESNDMLSFLYRLENAPTYLFLSSVEMEYKMKENRETYTQGSGLFQVETGDTEDIEDIESEENEFIAQGSFIVRIYTHKNSQEE